MRLAWASDIHLDHVTSSASRRLFYDSIREQADALVISGDIGESRDVCQFLNEIDTLVDLPTYFVLGNHDFYHGSIKDVRRMISKFSYETKRLIYLSGAPVLELTPTTAIVGHDGWGDGRLGDLNGSGVVLNDFVLIKELHCWKFGDTLDKSKLRKIIEQLGDEAAEHLSNVLLPAASKYEEVVVVTHVPPFQESAWYNGKQSTSDFMPFFSCKATGDVLLEAAKLNPKCNIKVLCGHTHGSGMAKILDNLTVFTAGAIYKQPVIQRIFMI